MKEIAEVCRARGVLFHCDAVQAAGKIEIDVSRDGGMPVDYLSITGHKLGAPKGIGALFVRRKAPFSGSACLADSDEPSHVVKAMKPDSTASRQMIRFSLDTGTTTAEIKDTLSAVTRTTAMLCSSAQQGLLGHRDLR